MTSPEQFDKREQPNPCGCPETTGGPYGTPGPMCMGDQRPGCRKRAEADALARTPSAIERTVPNAASQGEDRKATATAGQSPTTIPATAAQLAQWLDEGFSIKVLNPEHGTYWKCPHCGMGDYDGHEQSCVIRVMVEHIRFAQSATGPTPEEHRVINAAMNYARTPAGKLKEERGKWLEEQVAAMVHAADRRVDPT